jgi:ribosomal protein L16 Arg81 hydroxylase
VSPAGAVSPLHYDTSTSFLVQVAGAKRMLFFSPDQLHRLYCYPDTHLLRRRSRVNVIAPDLTKFPLFADAAVLEIVLQPGDVVCFPSYWSHHTESLGQQPLSAQGRVADPAGCSMSITFRCQPAA